MRVVMLFVACVGAVKFVDLDLNDGPYTGQVVKNFTAPTWRFLGVPYAAPPVGPLRWQAPQPTAKHIVPKPALTYSASCVQGSNAFTEFTKTSEDCKLLALLTQNLVLVGIQHNFVQACI
jgi:carboxylesterase type B